MQVWLFDIDGTLMVSGGAGRLAVADTLVSAFSLPPETDAVSFSGRTDQAIVGELFDLHGVAKTTGNWQKFQQHYLQHLPSQLKKQEGRVLEGVVPILQQCAASENIQLGILTGNVKLAADEKLAFYDLANYFSFGGFGDNHEDRNLVAADALSDAERHLDRKLAPASDVWVIGDTPRDVECAHAIGARVVAVATGGYSQEQLAETKAELVVESLEQNAEFEKLFEF